MKRKLPIFLALIIICLLSLGLCACGKGTTSDQIPEEPESTEQQTTQSSQSSDPSQPAHVHAYGEWQVVTPATCVTPGTKKRVCSGCNEEETKTLPKLGHNYVDGVCTRCEKVIGTDGLQYAKEGEGYVVTGYTGTATKVIIPDEYEGLPVILIGYHAFRYCRSLTSITIPDSVMSIGNEAFLYCSSLTSVTIGSGVTSIGNEAFYNCSSLTSVYYTGDIASWCGISFGYYGANPLEYAHNLYINNTLVTEITIPDTVTEIKAYAFKGWNGTSIIIPDNVTYIEADAFSYCYKLVEVYNKSSLNITKGSSDYGYVGYNAKAIYTEPYVRKLSTDENGYILYTDGNDISLIGYIGVNTVLTLPSGITEINQYAFYDNNTITSITISDSVTSIGDAAFYDCSKLTSVTIGSGVTSIGGYAFSYCSSITSVTIGNSVTSIGNSVFSYCNRLTSITIGSGVTSIGSSAFSHCSSLTSVYYTGDIASWCGISFGDSYANPLEYARNLYINNTLVTEITIPDTVTEIKAYAFYGWNGMSVTIPDSVTSIGNAAFYNCSSLTSITIGNSVTSIGNAAFYNCSSLTSITIGNSVTSIGYEAFRNCSSLTSITIPNSVTSIGSYAFYDCSSLTSVTIGNGVTSIGDYAFSGCSSLVSITVPFIGNRAEVTSSDTYQYPLGYLFGTSSYTGGTGVLQYSTSSTTNSYYYIPSTLRSVTVTGGYIPFGAFYNCTMLTSITLEENVTSIGNGAFYDCSSLTSITIPDSVTSIGSSAFYNCSNLTSISIPDSVTSIGNYAFYGCSNLTSITIGNSVTSIGNYAFEDCSSLTSITIGSGVTSIGRSAFRECRSLTSITFEGTKAHWDAIFKSSGWNSNTGKYTIHCTDGNISK